VIVVPAPVGHAMKIADILGLRQREELRPRQGQRILDEPADFELPRLDGDVRVVAKIHHGPVSYFALSDRQLRHAVPVRLTGPRRLAAGEFDVDRALVERDLPVDISLTAFDEIVLMHEHIVPPKRWTEAKMVAEVAFAEWTSDGSIRHPSFQGLREDKNPKEVMREEPTSGKSKKTEAITLRAEFLVALSGPLLSAFSRHAAATL
jgi:ATP dependent DNA ligase-like protein